MELARATNSKQAYFREAGLKFLRSLRRNNRREWFEAHRQEFERECKQPMLALIETINGAMDDFAPAHARPPQKIMMRIYRDIRFSSDKRPYKSHVSAWWSRAGLEKNLRGWLLHAYLPRRSDDCRRRVYAGARAAAGDTELPCPCIMQKCGGCSQRGNCGALWSPLPASR